MEIHDKSSSVFGVKLMAFVSLGASSECAPMSCIAEDISCTRYPAED